jgi:hypothetical protein
MSRYQYNRQVSPPAPSVHVSVRSVAVNSAVAECPAQLDTAADLTVIPSRLVDELQFDQLSDLDYTASQRSSGASPDLLRTRVVLKITTGFPK